MVANEEFREAMSRLGAGVVMVTCELDSRPWGLTVSACCSVSGEPPLLLVSLGAETASTHAILQQRRFGVSVLGESLVDAARFGSTPGQAKFVQNYCRFDVPQSNTPVLSGALTHLDCTTEQQMQVGDHILFIGHVRSVVFPTSGRPLIYFGRRYHPLGQSVPHVGDEAIDSLLYDYPLPRKFELTNR